MSSHESNRVVAQPILLTGMPGVGKTTCGRILARLLAVDFVDLDRLFLERHGMTPARAIKQHSERYFRDREARLLRGLLNRGQRVIACGGGALARKSTLEPTLKAGVVVSLTASVHTLVQRLTDASNHPLLAGDDLEGALAALYGHRKDHYQRCHVAIDTDAQSPMKVALAIRHELKRLGIAGYSWTRCPASFAETSSGREAFHELGERSYPIRIVDGRRVRALGELLDDVTPGGHCCVMVDDYVNQRFASQIRAGLRGRDCRFISLPPGEAAKAPERLQDYLSNLLLAGATRQTTVLAIGGGSTLDAAGFAASVFMRGVPAVYVPTTLLAAVDAAVGGKTAMNLALGKNLAGTFAQPAGVLISVPMVRAEIETRGGVDGAAEFVKTCLLSGLGDDEILRFAGRKHVLKAARLAEAIELAVSYKMDVVSQDEREVRGQRMCLNLGHTAAHAIERASGYRISHGRAVGWGLVVAARMSVALGVAEPGLVARIQRICVRFGLWPRPDVRLDQRLLHRPLYDKKQSGNDITLVLLEGPGRPVLKRVNAGEARNLMVSCL